ncbi:MAG: thioredoxin family protein [Candidatus Obscuribacterales bacterium]
MNRKALAAIASLCVMMFAVMAVSGARAESSPRDAAVKAYKAKKYSDAVTQLQACLQATPNDDLSHYYLALSYQQLKQLTEARKEYEWVVSSSSNESLKSKAQQGLQNLDKAAGKSAEKASASAKPAAAVTAIKPKVIEFSATWCGPCKRFAPTFEKVSGMFNGKIDVQKIDIDDKATMNITEKYNVHAVPTIVFLDSKGNVVNSHVGGMDEQELTSTMQSLVGR